MAAAAASSAPAQSIPFRTVPVDAGVDWLRLVVGLLVCLALLAAALYVLRRRMGVSAAPTGQATRVVSQTFLAPGQHLVVVEFGEEQLLLARTKDSVSLLRARPIERSFPPVASPAPTVRVEHST